jgi:cobalt/nickel transport system permease protein
LALLLLAMLTIAVLRTLSMTSLALGVVVLLALLARMPWGWYQERLLILAVPIAFFVLPVPFLSTGTWSEGMRLAGLFTVKAVALSMVAAVGMICAPLDVTLKAAHALRVPGLLIQLGLMSYRYLFVLGDELARLRVALRVRGFRNQANWHSYNTVGQAVGTLFVRGQERAERIAHAMRCRGFDGRFRSLTTFRTRPKDVLAVALSLALGTALIVWDRLLA